MKKLILLPLLLTILSCSSTTNITEGYGIEIVSIGTQGETRHVKFNRVTGESWWSENTVWKPIIDIKPIPESQYIIKIISTGKSWRALRIDTFSGDTWKNSRGRWVPFKQ